MIFKCIKETTYRGRIVRPGEELTLDAKTAASFKGNPCWEAKEEVKPAPKKGKKAKAEDPLA